MFACAGHPLRIERPGCRQELFCVVGAIPKICSAPLPAIRSQAVSWSAALLAARLGRLATSAASHSQSPGRTSAFGRGTCNLWVSLGTLGAVCNPNALVDIALAPGDPTCNWGNAMGASHCEIRSQGCPVLTRSSGTEVAAAGGVGRYGCEWREAQLAILR